MDKIYFPKSHLGNGDKKKLRLEREANSMKRKDTYG